MPPRMTDWGLALLVGAGFGSGLWTLTLGRPAQGWVVVAHGGLGLALGLLTLIKLRRVRWRLLPRRLWRWPPTAREPRTLAGVGATLLVLLTLGSGVGWVQGGGLVVAGYNLLNWHIVAAFVLVALVSTHMLARALPLRRTDVADRRQILRLSRGLLGGVLLSLVPQGVQQALRLPGAGRRFTGSRELASGQGDAMPVVSWLADQPRPIAVGHWRLAVGGAVEQPLTLPYAVLERGERLDAPQDGTGGFYSTQVWHGGRVGALLAQAGVGAAAAAVSLVSATGYRWSLPLAAAHDALLATHLGGAPRRHGHGAPLR